MIDIQESAAAILSSGLYYSTLALGGLKTAVVSVGGGIAAFPFTSAIVALTSAHTIHMLTMNNFAREIREWGQLSPSKGDKSIPMGEDQQYKVIGMAALSTVLNIASIAGVVSLCIMGSTMTPLAVGFGITGIVTSCLLSHQINENIKDIFDHAPELGSNEYDWHSPS